jgi:sugar lactone lactonase YvrE
MKQAELYHKVESRLGEAIIWHEAQQCLFWIDLFDPSLWQSDPRTGKTQSWTLPFKTPIGAIVATEDPYRLLVTHPGGLAFLDTRDLSISQYCDPEQGRDAIIYNDAKCDQWGRLWVGTAHALESDPRGALWCVADRSRFALGDVGFEVSNGPAFSPDGRTMYFNDSVGRRTIAYDIRPDDLHPTNRRVIRNYAKDDEGIPDGAIVDAEGLIWIAHWGGSQVSRMTSDGQVVARYPVPARNVTTMCFAGPDFRTLYVTTARDGMDEGSLKQQPNAGSVFSIETNVRGLPEPLLKLG